MGSRFRGKRFSLRNMPHPWSWNVVSFLLLLPYLGKEQTTNYGEFVFLPLSQDRFKTLKEEAWSV